MKKNKIFALMAAAMTFAACSTNDITSDTRYDDDNNVVNVGTVTRAGEGSTTSQFTGTFLLTNVTQRENVGDNYEATYEYDSNNSTWTAQDNAKIMWYGSRENVFQATYPCQTNSGNVQKNDDFNRFVIPGYQNENSDSIPDWMRATANVARNNGALNLNFEHMLSKVTVVIDYNNITLDDKAVTNASVSKIFTRVQYCEAVTGEDGNVTINPYQNTYYNTDGLYVWTTPQRDDDNKKASTTAIVAPGAYSNIAKVSVSYDGGSEEEVVLYLPTGYTLEAGKHYTFTLSSGDITHDAAKITSVSVEPWREGSDISSSKPAEFIPYVTFTSNEEVGFKMTTKNEYSDFIISGLEYSVNNGEWKTIPSKGMSDADTFGGSNGNLRLRGKNLNGTATYDENYATISFTSSKSSAKVACTGDIRTLLDYENYNTVYTKDARFFNLFDGCTQLTSAPELPATDLANYCYYEMFKGCTSLTTAPELPATTLAYHCYENMFSGCTSLTKAPELPATTLANCDYCYSKMFNGCTSLTTAPELKAEELAGYCYTEMFSGCTALTTAPELKAETLASFCYAEMFSGCTALTRAPELKAEILADFCYYYMFSGCTNLESVTMLATGVSAWNCLKNWLDGAGNSDQISSRTLKVNSQTEYDAIKSNLPANWQAGATGAKILDKDGNDITSTIPSSSSN